MKRPDMSVVQNRAVQFARQDKFDYEGARKNLRR
jgi:hypothetical protein